MGLAAKRQRRAEAKDRRRKGLPPKNAQPGGGDEDDSGDEGSFGELSDDEEGEGRTVTPVKKEKPRKRGTIPFAPGERILCVGEGEPAH